MNGEMERLGRMWRRKPSERGSEEPGSSSEKFPDDDHEVAFKLAECKDQEGTIKELEKRLEDAVSQIHEKEELVKQHIKVAEEAVSGWEKAESEVSRLRQQLKTKTVQNSTLQENIQNLEVALKESIKQLSYTRWGKELKFNDPPVKESSSRDLQDSSIPSNVDRLKCHPVTTEAETMASANQSIQWELDEVKRQNSDLKHELLSVSEQLRLRNLDVEYGVKVAETASKLHLESKLNVARLEAECRSLKGFIRRKAFKQETCMHTSDRCTKELDNLVAKISQNDQLGSHGSIMDSTKVHLMDDFLEMEKLATTLGDHCNGHLSEARAVTDQPSSEDLKGGIHLEDKIAVTESNSELQNLLTKNEVSRNLGAQEKTSTQERDFSCKPVQVSESAPETAETKGESSKAAETEIRKLSKKVSLLEEKLANEQMRVKEFAMKCQKWEADMSKKIEVVRRRAAVVIGNMKFKQEKELSAGSEKLEECQKTIVSLGRRLTSLQNFTVNNDKMENEE